MLNHRATQYIYSLFLAKTSKLFDYSQLFILFLKMAIVGAGTDFEVKHRTPERNVIKFFH